MSCLSKEQENFILNNHSKMTAVEMSELFDGIKPYQITYFLRKNGIIKYSRRNDDCASFSSSDVEYMKNHYIDMKYKDIAKELGYTERQIRGKINNMGLTKIRDFNEEYFDNIDTSLKAYFLGFIYADGWVCCNKDTSNYEFGIELQESDKYVIEKLNSELGGVHKIHKKESEEKIICGNLCKSGVIYGIRVYSKHLIDSLIKHGIETNKTQKETFPVVEDEYFFDFLRGYIDGDGCYYVDGDNTYMHITCCTYPVLEYIKEKLTYYNIKTTIYKENDKKYRIYCTSNEEMCKLVNRLYYEDDLFCLQRKYKIIKHFLGFAA